MWTIKVCKNYFALSRIDDTLQTLTRGHVVLNPELEEWLVASYPAPRQLDTTFSTDQGLQQVAVMLLGHCNTPRMFKWLMEPVLHCL